MIHGASDVCFPGEGFAVKAEMSSHSTQVRTNAEWCSGSGEDLKKETARSGGSFASVWFKKESGTVQGTQ